jgi:hypothetical protein
LRIALDGGRVSIGVIALIPGQRARKPVEAQRLLARAKHQVSTKAARTIGPPKADCTGLDVTCKEDRAYHAPATPPLEQKRKNRISAVSFRPPEQEPCIADGPT